jgi:hypothetical protein
MLTLFFVSASMSFPVSASGEEKNEQQGGNGELKPQLSVSLLPSQSEDSLRGVRYSPKCRNGERIPVNRNGPIKQQLPLGKQVIHTGQL